MAMLGVPGRSGAAQDLLCYGLCRSLAASKRWPFACGDSGAGHGNDVSLGSAIIAGLPGHGPLRCEAGARVLLADMGAGLLLIDVAEARSTRRT